MNLAPPVQIATRCTACGHERGTLAMNQKALEEAMRCERCKEPADVLGAWKFTGLSCTNCW